PDLRARTQARPAIQPVDVRRLLPADGPHRARPRLPRHHRLFLLLAGVTDTWQKQSCSKCTEPLPKFCRNDDFVLHWTIDARSLPTQAEKCASTTSASSQATRSPWKCRPMT